MKEKTAPTKSKNKSSKKKTSKSKSQREYTIDFNEIDSIPVKKQQDALQSIHPKKLFKLVFTILRITQHHRKKEEKPHKTNFG